MSAFHDKARKEAEKHAPDFPMRLLFREVASDERAGAKFLGLVGVSDTEVMAVTSASVTVVRERLIGAKGRSWPLDDIEAVTVDAATLVLRLVNGRLEGIAFSGRARPDDAMHAKNAWRAHDLIARAAGL